MKTITKTKKVKSADRIIQILELLASRSEGFTHVEIATCLAIPKSSLTGLLKSLTDSDLIEIDLRIGTYSLSFGVLKYARAYHEKSDLISTAKPLLNRLVVRTNEACALTLRRGADVIVVWKVDDPNAGRPSLSLQLGQTGALHASASGKAMLAFQSEKDVQQYLALLDNNHLSNRPEVNRTKLKAELQDIRTTKIGFSRGEMFADITAMGAAVRGEDGEIVAGISVSFTRDRETPQHVSDISEALIAASDELSLRLGYQGLEKS